LKKFIQMKKSILYILLIMTIGIFSCNKTEIEDLPDDVNKLNPTDDSSLVDTVGVNPLLGDKYLAVSRKEQRLFYYAMEEGMYSIAAIALPECDNTDLENVPDSILDIFMDCAQSNYFYGYPSAIEVNGKIMVVAERRESEKFVNSKSDNFILMRNSENKWEQTDFFKYAPYGYEFIYSRPMVGKTSSGQIVLKGKGLLVSDGDVEKWTHYPHAFDSLLDVDFVDHGPVMTNSSKFGLFFGTGQYTDKLVKKYGKLIAVDPDNGTLKIAKENWVPQVQRFDGSYRDFSELYTPTFHSVEHSDLAGNIGDIIGFGIYKDKVYQFIYKYKSGDTFDNIDFVYSVTNIKGSTNRHSPVGICYNPVTKRFEMIHSSPYYLEIYSIDPASLLSNEVNAYDVAVWTKEAILIDREVSVRGQGLYPVSNLIDEANGIQRIYIFAGDEYPARAGLFEVTRSLETDKLSEFVERRRNILAEQLF